MSHPKSKKKLMEQAARASANPGEGGGKIDNDRNKPSAEGLTQKNEPKRTPLSRSDRESNIGNNQTQARRGGPNSGVVQR